MLISYNWLKSYLDIDLSPEVLGDILTNIGLEVEGMESFYPVKGGLEGVVVGEVLSCEKHPNADKLSLTMVDLGQEEPVQIVCGAPNVASGQKVAVATVGCTLYPNEEGFSIKKAKIRGELSMGMICGEDELGLGRSHEGIMVLREDALNGTPAADYFGIEADTVFEIGLTPNRIDAASHLGVARDLAAYLKQEKELDLNWPDTSAFKADHKDLPMEVRVENPEACIRYSGLTMTNVKVEESPEWLKTRLRSIGMSPINNVVDITNFVLHETGQPLHAFDAEKIRGGQVLVKTLPGGSSFTTLDEKERKLRDSDLMICDQEGGMCIAGVFGGIDSGVSDKTGCIFLESACFDPVFVRKTARHHVLNTDASFRFERGTDPNMTIPALKRAALLIKEIAGGEISSDIYDIYPEPLSDHRVELKFAHVDRLLGQSIPHATIVSILESLDIGIEQHREEGLELRVPPYRVDVKREADVIEEILRIYGFNRIKTGNSLRSTLVSTEKPDREKAINMIAEQLTARGFYEMMSNSLTRSAYYDSEDGPDPGAVRLHNPLSQDLSVMRKTLLYGGLEAIAYNINRKNANLRLYEFGSCYQMRPEAKPDGEADDRADRESERPGKGLALEKRFREDLRLGIFMSGKDTEGNWHTASVPSSFFQLKSHLEMVLERLGLDPRLLETTGGSHPDFTEYQCMLKNGKKLAEFGRISADTLKTFDIEQDVFAAEIYWDQLLHLAAKHRTRFSPLPRFQIITRDLSLLLDQEVQYSELRELAYQSEKKLLKNVRLFDVYEGEKIEEGKKSYALSFTLLDEEKTLNDKQIDKAMMNIARAFEQRLGAKVRGLS